MSKEQTPIEEIELAMSVQGSLDFCDWLRTMLPVLKKKEQELIKP
jgi:hypothetical protein